MQALSYFCRSFTLLCFQRLSGITIYVFALLDKRRNYYKGAMTYMQGFVSGLIISVIVTVLSPLTQYITSYVITPEFFQNAIKYVIEYRRHKLKRKVISA